MCNNLTKGAGMKMYTREGKKQKHVKLKPNEILTSLNRDMSYFIINVNIHRLLPEYQSETYQ